MINYIDLTKIKSIIENNSNFIISTHISPDGDAIGSSVGLCSFLRKIGKSAKIINSDKTPSHLEFLDPEKFVEVFDLEKHADEIKKCEVIFLLDLNALNRIGRLSELVQSTENLKVVIDHHLDPQEFADFNYKDTDIASTSEIIFELIKLFDEDYDFISAQALYTGIVTDTGGFAFDRTTSRTHLIAADLLKHNVKTFEINDNIYNSKDLNSLHLYGEALKSIELFCGNKFAFMTISQDMLQRANKTEGELEGYSVAPLMIKSVKCAVTIVELEQPNTFKLSFRAKVGYGIRNIAMKLGGGGHDLAAGAKVSNISIEELKSEILKDIEDLNWC